MVTKTKTKMALTSPSFAAGGLIGAQHTCDGANLSPELRWSGAPEGARTFALIVEDPDAPSGTFTHWVLFDIPGARDGLDLGAADVGVPGSNDFKQVGYGGPCPPPKHGPHRYFFRLYALDAETLELPQAAMREEVERAMEHHVLGEAELMGRYERG